jgi:transposase
MLLNFDSMFWGSLQIATIKGDKTLAEISSLYNVSPKRACVWKKQLLEQVNLVYENGNGNQRIELEYENKISDLHRKIGELSIENEYLKKKLN